MIPMHLGLNLTGHLCPTLKVIELLLWFEKSGTTNQSKQNIAEDLNPQNHGYQLKILFFMIQIWCITQ
jgi:hypothetical protein